MMASLGFLLAAAAAAQDVEVLFLGDSGHHRPAERSRQLIPVLKKRGINIVYTEKLEDLNPGKLSAYHGLLIYANHRRLSPEQERAMKRFVTSGGGLIPLHCASACFGNSKEYIRMVGGRFKSHKTGTFRTLILAPDHPVMKGFNGFESWDETYVHDRHNDDNRTILSKREDEPWTWVRTEGKGRVFYTAWGHDARTWSNPGFHDLVERGIRWAVANAGPVEADPDNPRMMKPRTDVKPFEYREAKIAYYPPGGPRRGDGAWKQMQLPLDPAESEKHYVTPVGFEIRLFAAEPDIRPPLAMSWDERGRLWVCESIDYPNSMQPEGKGNDSIRICEDTDGDGRADKFTLFADKL